MALDFKQVQDVKRQDMGSQIWAIKPFQLHLHTSVPTMLSLHAYIRTPEKRMEILSLYPLPDSLPLLLSVLKRFTIPQSVSMAGSSPISVQRS